MTADNSPTETPRYISHDGKRFEFNDLVVVECLLGVPDEKRIGRLVQVRKGAGAFKSDLLILRLRDGSLMSYHNALLRSADDNKFEDAFYRSNGRTPPLVHKADSYPSDGPDEEYTLNDQWPERGFIIESPKQPDHATQSFSMMIAQAPECLENIQNNGRPHLGPNALRSDYPDGCQCEQCEAYDSIAKVLEFNPDNNKSNT